MINFIKLTSAIDGQEFAINADKIECIAYHMDQDTSELYTAIWLDTEREDDYYLVREHPRVFGEALANLIPTFSNLHEDDEEAV